MKVGLFIDTFFPMIDGVIKVVDNYARHLSKMCDVVVFAPHLDGEDDSNLPYEVIRCHSVPIKQLDYSLPTPMLDPKFLNDLLLSKLDIVHIHSPFSIGLAGVNYAKFHKVPIIATLHSQLAQDANRNLKLKVFEEAFMFMVMNVYNQCDECWAVNDSIKHLYEIDYGLESYCKVRYNATEHQPVVDRKSACEEINKRYQLLPDEDVYLFVGRIDFIKNIDFLVRSLKILKNKYHRKFKMMFVGQGRHESDLKELVHSLDLDSEVILCGAVKDLSLLEKIYCRAKLFLFPSLYDANSLVQIEAATQSTPTLFLKGAKTASTATENVNAFFSDNSEDDYAAKIDDILSNPELLKTVSKGAFRDLSTNWADTIKEAYDDYVRKCEIKEKKRRLINLQKLPFKQ